MNTPGSTRFEAREVQAAFQSLHLYKHLLSSEAIKDEATNRLISSSTTGNEAASKDMQPNASKYAKNLLILMSGNDSQHI